MLSHLLIARSALSPVGHDLSRHAALNCGIVNLARRGSSVPHWVARTIKKLTRRGRPYAASRGSATLH